MLQPGGVRKAQKPLSAKKSLIISTDALFLMSLISLMLFVSFKE